MATLITNRPAAYLKPIADDAVSGTYITASLPTTATGTGAASIAEGFPPKTMQDPTTTGIPPQGQDMNAFLKLISTHGYFLSAGGRYRWDSALVAASGGYPAGFVLQSDDGLSEFVSLVNNNTTNFNTAPVSTTIGVKWGHWAGKAAMANIVNDTDPLTIHYPAPGRLYTKIGQYTNVPLGESVVTFNIPFTNSLISAFIQPTGVWSSTVNNIITKSRTVNSFIVNNQTGSVIPFVVWMAHGY